MTQTVWLTRHGNRQDFVDPDWPKTAARPHDPDLSPDGIVQAELLGERLAGETIAYIFASPFLRTAHTASIVAEALDLTVFLESGIAEWMNADWFPEAPSILTREQLAARFPRIDLRYEAREVPSYPETEAQAMERAGRTAKTIAASYPRAILLVGHGVSVAGAAEGLMPGADVTECALCSLFRAVRRNGRWHLDLRGDVAHLDHRAAGDRFA